MIIILILPVETLRPDQIKWTCLVLQDPGPDSLAPESMSPIMAAHSHLPWSIGEPAMTATRDARIFKGKDMTGKHKAEA